MVKPCRKCGEAFEVPLGKARKHDYICRVCRTPDAKFRHGSVPVAPPPLCACGCGEQVSRRYRTDRVWVKGHQRGWKNVGRKMSARKAAAQRAWAEKNRDKVRAATRRYRVRHAGEPAFWHLKRYGVSREQYEQMKTAQGDLCAICGETTPGGKLKVWCVDHCHKTGKVRGLLCRACNAAVGLLRDSPRLAERAAEYLRKTSAV